MGGGKIVILSKNMRFKWNKAGLSIQGVHEMGENESKVAGKV